MASLTVAVAGVGAWLLFSPPPAPPPAPPPVAKPPPPKLPRVEVLTRELRHSDPAVRRGAAVALGRLAGEATRALPALEQSLEDPETKLAALAALVELRDVASQILVRLLSVRRGERRLRVGITYPSRRRSGAR